MFVCGMFFTRPISHVCAFSPWNNLILYIIGLVVSLVQWEMCHCHCSSSLPHTPPILDFFPETMGLFDLTFWIGCSFHLVLSSCLSRPIMWYCYLTSSQLGSVILFKEWSCLFACFFACWASVGFCFYVFLLFTRQPELSCLNRSLRYFKSRPTPCMCCNEKVETFISHLPWNVFVELKCSNAMKHVAVPIWTVEFCFLFLFFLVLFWPAWLLISV